jgi:hypothetical protein
MRTSLTPIRAEGWNHYIERQISSRWPPVCRDWFPDGGDVSLDWTWKFFQYVFPLEDPRSTVGLANPAWSPAERAALDRYLSHARDLAGAEVLTAQNGYDVYMATLDSEPEITETASARDATVGFLTMLRQCYAPTELASFQRVYNLVAREVDREAGKTLKAWRRTHAALRHEHLDHLILVEAAGQALVPAHLAERNASLPSETDSPEQMIGTMFYGDTIHWGDRRTVIEDWDRGHAVFAVKRRFDALRAAVHLGHLYVAFAAVVGVTTGSLSRSDL